MVAADAGEQDTHDEAPEDFGHLLTGGADGGGWSSVRHRGAPGAGTESSRRQADRKSTRLNSSHVEISYAVFCLKKKKEKHKMNLVIFNCFQNEYRVLLRFFHSFQNWLEFFCCEHLQHIIDFVFIVSTLHTDE